MAKKTTKRKTTAPKPKPKCGLVMPIASTPNCTESHWREVKEIFVSALKSKFETELVSEEPEVDVIQSKIVNNLHDNPLVAVDVSELNPNVMFELGLRLAFDKPTILIKDDKTDWKFDISPLETLVYPRDLRHSKIETFKKNLLKKALATHEKRVAEGESYSQYLKHFKRLERKTIETEEVGDMELVLKRLESIENSVASKASGSSKYLYNVWINGDKPKCDSFISEELPKWKYRRRINFLSDRVDSTVLGQLRSVKLGFVSHEVPIGGLEVLVKRAIAYGLTARLTSF